MPNAKITKREVDAAKAGDKDWFLWDAGEKDTVKGFGLKVTPAGGKIYIFQYRIARPGLADRTPAKRRTIGKHGEITPDQARTMAKALAKLVHEGIDPREQELEADAANVEAKRLAIEKARVEGELAFEIVAALWLDHYENTKDRRPSSVRLAKLVVDNHLSPKLKGKPMPHIGRADLQRVLDAIPTRQRGMRRAVYAYASVLFGWASKRGDIPGNPLVDMLKPEPPKARDRVLSDDEVRHLWRASQTLEAPFGPFFRLLIATGQRRAEVAGISWAELEQSTATWTIPADRAKNGQAHIVPLSAKAVAELDGLGGAEWPTVGFVLTTTGKTPISGFTKAKAGLEKAIAEARNGEALPQWRIHDIRRTVATGFQRLGIRFEVTEAILNHVSGAKAGVAGIYQRHDWKEEKRDALKSWSRHIEQLLEPANRTNVVKLQSAAA
ncbi:tyrosine-type recombinase/integrase [Sphingomonas sp. CFBP 13706]|uniref:tyrosine-type recombinase/integrase n=1 Tax=Sphingomonas sp. CFBP 13706 TaxID=2775314 RepID=UPI001781422C|nr:site-specific integrase [Sphingomonas sp. CFBP 13706]MBD8735704.1 integrase arm-type DNA-binding domain-containing protein [Sphingomonas sp. CFBP 13706]